ncbi:tyrosinase family protein [Agromyces sp. MMS24-K17]|uniref:tyrosinase family protein n=1 Tax=Agromyces sp. MMS24-K17 TaxID=3372850 RepID=UPI0037544EC1
MAEDDLRVRRDIWALQPTAAEPWHPIVDAYERAVAVMQEDGAVPPKHWGWQAAIHGIPGGSNDPRLEQCQHGTWYFLPWHRIYLANFEQALREVIETLPDVSDEVKATWALPYWNYHRPGADSIPHPFRARTRGNRRNFLFDPRPGGMPLSPGSLDTSSWLDVPLPFSGPLDGPFSTVTFGGEQTGFLHEARGGGTGHLEFAPHNSVHGQIGGNMGDPATAGIDPLFWLHHANIDRLWEVWRTTPAGLGRDETSAAYLDLEFPFLETDGQTTSPWTARQVVETAGLGYAYEDLSKPGARFVNGVPVPEAPEPEPGRGPGPFEEGVVVPEPSEPPVPPEGEGAPPRPLPLPEPRQVQRIGALDRTLRLRDGEESRIEIPLEEAPVRAFEEGVADEAAAAEPPTRYFVRVDHFSVRGTSNRMYELYLDPDGEGTEVPRFVAVLSPFGAQRAEGADAEHGLSFTFEVTRIVEDLARRGAWNPELARVSLRLDGEPTEESPAPDVSIGSIDLFAG